MIIRKVMHNRSVRSFILDESLLMKITEHITERKKMSVYREWIYDADGDGKITLRDLIHRIKNIQGGDEAERIENKKTRHTVIKRPTRVIQSRTHKHNPSGASRGRGGKERLAHPVCGHESCFF